MNIENVIKNRARRKTALKQVVYSNLGLNQIMSLTDQGLSREDCLEVAVLAMYDSMTNNQTLSADQSNTDKPVS